MTATPRKGVGERLADLRQALRRLEGTEDRRIARANARAAVRTGCRRLLEVVEQLYPAIRKPMARRAPTNGRSVMRRAVARTSRWKAEGWRKLLGSTDTRASLLAAMAAAGVRARQDFWGSIWVPGWVLAVGPNVARLSKLRRDRVGQAAAWAESALGRMSSEARP